MQCYEQIDAQHVDVVMVVADAVSSWSALPLRFMSSPLL
jgi:hypothetical protein